MTALAVSPLVRRVTGLFAGRHWRRWGITPGAAGNREVAGCPRET